MKKKFLFITFFYFFSGLKAEKLFDELYYCSLATPIDENILLSSGFPHQKIAEPHPQTLWTGLGPLIQVNQELKTGLMFNKASLLLGPENPDPVSNFILGAHLPINFGRLTNEKDTIALNNKFSSFLTLTGRGFFGKNSGLLSNVEFFFQFGTKIPGTSSLANRTNFNLYQIKDAQLIEEEAFLEASNALFLGFNWHLIPNRLRIGTFFGLSPIVSNLGYLKQVGSFVKSTFLGGLDRFWPKKTEPEVKIEPSNIAKISSIDTKTSKNKKSASPSDKEKSITAISLSTVGMLAEASFWDEQLFVGGIFKKTRIPGVYLSESKIPPHFKEVSLFARTNSLLAFKNNYVSIPEIKLFCSMAFKQNSFKVEKTFVGLSAKITF